MGSKDESTGTANEFEVGMTYLKNGKYYLAVGDRRLVTLKDGELTEISPYSRYEPARSLSVEALCKHWGVSLERLDQLTAKFFTPQLCHDASPSYRTAQRRNMFREPSIRTVSLVPRLAG